MKNPFEQLGEKPILEENERLVEFKDEDGKLIWRKRGSVEWNVEYNITTGTPTARQKMAEIEARVKQETSS